MAANENPEGKSKKDAAKYLKRYKDNVEKGMSEEEAMAKAMAEDDDMHDVDDVDSDSVDKALSVVADLVKGGAMDKQLLSTSQADEIRKGMNTEVTTHVVALSKESHEVRKSIREMTGAHREGFDGLCKAIAAQNEVIKGLAQQVSDLRKGGAVASSTLEAPKVAEEPKGVQVLPTSADTAQQAESKSTVTVDDFLQKSLDFLGKNPTADHQLRKGLVNTNTALCSGGSLKDAIAQYGDVLGIKG